MDFCKMSPDEIIKLDLNQLSYDELITLDYFLWCFYPEEPESIVNWRTDTLLPLLDRIEDQETEDDEDGEDEYDDEDDDDDEDDFLDD